ncbi:MAG TPA: chorismate mutase [Gemmatimonadota bacterium]|nr:chorismate mutase [Gemmatimonadota bacterium]
MKAVRAIRGAVQAAEDAPAAIESATRELLSAIMDRNGLVADDLVAVWFTQTPDLTAAHAAAAARGLGWTSVPLLSALEVPVDGQLPRVVRALVLAQREGGVPEVRHVYLGGASVLREDLA